MEVIHNLGILSIKKNTEENVGFLLTNKKGSYCSFFNAPFSRHLGLFYFDEKTMGMYKFIENIEINGDNNVARLKNNFHYVERRKNDAIESFIMPRGFNSLVYELSSENEIDIFLDCKDSYDNREFGRYYDISEEDGCIIIKFTKKTDRREDTSDGVEEFVLYLAIKSDNTSYQKNDKWIERYYTLDEERNSPPFKRYVYNALRLKGSKFVFSMSKNRNDAIKECEHIFNNINEIKINEKKHFFNHIIENKSIKNVIKNERVSKEIKVAYVNALNSLSNLMIDASDNYGVFAGLPWFFQFWARDALVSLKALSKIDDRIAKKLFYKYLNKINNGGRLQNLTGKHKSINLGNADAHGWLFLRCKELADGINRNKEIINSIKKSMLVIRQNKHSNSERVKEYFKNCNSIITKKENEYHKLIYDVESSLEKSLNGLLKFHTKDGFEVNNKLETWMDTDFGNDTREGIRIEIQALRLNMYKLMFELTQNQKYKVLENLLKSKVKKFWNGKILADGLNDFTIRSNIFIATYVYPELLTRKEWETCFENSLKNLWLDWGGLSTIDKNSKLFTNISTGEDAKSYHRGDSWFWINNLAALVLNRLNKIKFKKQIQKIIDASTEEILWKGCIGCHAELSSAKGLQSRGCFNQAWSNAMFIEMVDEMFG